MEYKHFALELKDINGKEGIVTGYLSGYGNLDYQGDIIKYGAAAKTIKERGQPDNMQIKYFIDHVQVLGNMLKLEEHTKGLYYEGKVGTVSLGRYGRITKEDVLSMLDEKMITEHSIGFETIKKHYETATGEIVGDERKWDAGIIRVIDEMKLYEGSLVTTFAANPNTPVTGLKTLTDIEGKEIIEKLEKALHNGHYTDDTMRVFEKALSEIKSILTNPKKEPEQAEDTHDEPPETETTIKSVSDDLVKQIFINSLKLRT